VKDESDNRRAGFLEVLMMKYKAKCSCQWTGWREEGEGGACQRRVGARGKQTWASSAALLPSVVSLCVLLLPASPLFGSTTAQSSVPPPRRRPPYPPFPPWPPSFPTTLWFQSLSKTSSQAFRPTPEAATPPSSDTRRILLPTSSSASPHPGGKTKPKIKISKRKDERCVVERREEKAEEGNLRKARSEMAMTAGASVRASCTPWSPTRSPLLLRHPRSGREPEPGRPFEHARSPV